MSSPLHGKQTAARRTSIVLAWLCNFFPFGHVKHLFGGNDIPVARRITCGNSSDSGGYLKETFQGMFDHWMERLEWMSQNNDYSYPSAKHWLL
jgi:hypothetical protein